MDGVGVEPSGEFSVCSVCSVNVEVNVMVGIE